MKSFPTDRPGYGQFEFSTASKDGNSLISLSERLSASAVCHSYVWDSAVARRSALGGFYRGCVKSVLDIIFVALTLPFSVPLIALCAIALWIEGGSPFYTQDRLGKNGRKFSILKLRTMVRDADAVLEHYLTENPALRREWNEKQKLKDDPRVTRVGQFLRTSSLDELPQLLNVLKGDMTLVGPRPMMPDQLTMYGDPSAYFALKPGITGLWQVSERNSARFSFRNESDAEYHRTVSFSADIAILLKTVGVVLRRTGC